MKGSNAQLPREQSVYQAFENFIIGRDHPCLMAQSVFDMEQVDLNVYSALGTEESAQVILKDLRQYLQQYDFDDPNDFYTFIAVFGQPKAYTEAEFETAMWQQLQHIHELDETPWDPDVDKDPQSREFSFSVLGKAFYMVGLHPNSSRIARQSPYPAIVFNLHWQFEQLRQMGVYQNVKGRIRERDEALQGHINPMLKDFGKASEARQYSGRAVGKDWKCPFQP